MVRANGQRDGVGKTSQLSGAFEHTGAILDPTRVSPYRPAAGDMPQSMRPDTREHLTACTKPSEGQMRRMVLASLGGVYLAHGLPRPSSRCAAPPLRCGPVGDCRGRPCGKTLRASRKAGPRSTGASARLWRAACLLPLTPWTSGEVHPLAPGWGRQGVTVVGPRAAWSNRGRNGVWSPPSFPTS